MAGKSGWHKLTDAERDARAAENRRSRMERIDAMPLELRALVHDYGLPIVETCTALGVTKARHIRHIVETVLDNFSPTRGCFSQQGVRTPIAHGIVTAEADETRSGSVERSEIEPGPARDAPETPIPDRREP